MKLTLSDGTVVEGTELQVQKVVRMLGLSMPAEGDGVHYRSSTHGLMRIEDMNTQHIINAALKLYRAEVDKLPRTRAALVDILRVGVVAQNKTLRALINELLSRRD